MCPEILQSIYQIEIITPNIKEKIKKTILLTPEQKKLSELFDLRC